MVSTYYSNCKNTYAEDMDSKFDWDEELPQDLGDAWQKYSNLLSEIQKLKKNDIHSMKLIQNMNSMHSPTLQNKLTLLVFTCEGYI